MKAAEHSDRLSRQRRNMSCSRYWSVSDCAVMRCVEPDSADLVANMDATNNFTLLVPRLTANIHACDVVNIRSDGHRYSKNGEVCGGIRMF